MIAVVQRCTSGAVTIEETSTTREISRGVVVLVGIASCDTEEDVEYVLKKVFKTRLFANADGKQWASSVLDSDLDVLLVSQFTLHASLLNNKPSFHYAKKPAEARTLYEYLLKRAREEYGKGRSGKIEDGQFGSMMQVRIVNDGPVTIIVDSRNRA